MQSILSKKLITLEEFIIQSQNRFPGATGELSQLLRDIGLAAKIISREINKRESQISWGLTAKTEFWKSSPNPFIRERPYS